MGEARGSEPGAPSGPSPRPRPAPDTACGVPSPGAPAPALEPRGAAHLRRRGQRAALTKQGQGHCKGAWQLLAAARRSTRSSQAGRRSPHRPDALTPRRERGVGGAWWGRWRARRLQAGRQGTAARKSYLRVIVRRTRTRGDPLALGEPALVAAICALRGARAGAGTCEAGKLGRGAMAGGEAAPQWRRRRRRGEEQSRRAPGGARLLCIPRPRRRHLAIASPTGSAAAPPPVSP